MGDVVKLGATAVAAMVQQQKREERIVEGMAQAMFEAIAMDDGAPPWALAPVWVQDKWRRIAKAGIAYLSSAPSPEA